MFKFYFTVPSKTIYTPNTFFVTFVPRNQNQRLYILLWFYVID